MDILYFAAPQGREAHPSLHTSRLPNMYPSISIRDSLGQTEPTKEKKRTGGMAWHGRIQTAYRRFSAPASLTYTSSPTSHVTANRTHTHKVSPRTTYKHHNPTISVPYPTANSLFVSSTSPLGVKYISGQTRPL
jgi:hypothetical protein